jgi:hypothetical protein
MSEVDKADSASVEQTVRQTLNEDPAPVPPVVVTKPSVTSQETSEALPGSWPNEDESISQVNSLAVEAEESDGASAHSNHVNDQILSHFRELEREKQAAATKVLGLDEYDSNETSHLAPTDLYQGQGPMIINHTELTPIMESSPRESLASEPASPIASPRLVSMKSRSSDERSPPGTRQSSHSGKGAGSTGSIVLSTDGANERARSSSLTSQAERLRSKFMNRNGKSSPDKELTVDTVAADPAKIERRMKFESLIRSGETMKLSLTPTTLRTIEVPPFSIPTDDSLIISLENMSNANIVPFLPESVNKLRRTRHANCLIFSVPPVRNLSSVVLLTNDVVHCQRTNSIPLLPNKPSEVCLQLLSFGMERQSKNHLSRHPSSCLDHR